MSEVSKQAGSSRAADLRFRKEEQNFLPRQLRPFAPLDLAARTDRHPSKEERLQLRRSANRARDMRITNRAGFGERKA